MSSPPIRAPRTAHQIEVGQGARELGDNLLIVGSVGVVVQVKSRTAPSDDAERERRWVEKQAGSALSQARGTVRRLRLQPVDLTNARGGRSGSTART